MKATKENTTKRRALRDGSGDAATIFTAGSLRYNFCRKTFRRRIGGKTP